MSFSGSSAVHQPPETTTTNGVSDPFKNLSVIQSRMDNLHNFLSKSVNNNTLITKSQMEIVNGEITSAIHQIIVNGSALLTLTQPQTHQLPQIQKPPKTICETEEPCEIVEMDVMELLAEHIHFCEICGKGFKRDANLRMHMRAHGNQFKTLEALSKPEVEKGYELEGKNARKRFSCPFSGCNRNKNHKKFSALKSVVCVKNHFKRSHCPKMYACSRCKKRSFSVLADLKSHLKHCGEIKWKCSCGTSFARKDKLFGHMALFEGHMPMVMEEGKEVSPHHEEDEVEGEDNDSGSKDVKMGNVCVSSEDNDGALFDGLDSEFGSIDNYSFQDILNSGNGYELGSGMDDFFNF